MYFILKVFSTPFGTLAISDLSVKILQRLSQGNSSIEGIKRKSGIAKYNHFGPFESYIIETVQYKLLLITNR